MDIGHVALNMTVCLSARVAPAISRISGSNPKSNILSASSNTSVVTRSSLTSPSFMKSRRRPGVATTTAQPPPSRICGSFHTSDCRGGVQRRQMDLKGAEGGD
eukprot:14306-Pelagococcus_subviridis.AAC.2